MKKFSFGRLIENKRFTMVFSILIAVIAWLVVVIQLDPMQKKVIRDIPVTYDLADTQADKLGLEVIKIEPANVSITVEGKRYQVSKLTQADFKVEFSAVSIQGAGSYTLELRASSKENSSEFQVANISPSTVNVTFDKVSSKTITLTAQAPNIKVEDDFILENPVPTPDKLEVKGPEQYIDRLDHGIIMTDASETLTQTTTKKGTLLLYDVDGNQLDNSWFTFDRETFEVVIPVYKQATVPLTFKYKNVPANLDTSKLEYSMSVNQINIAGSEDAVQNISEINLGYIDIRELDVGKTFQFNISVPSGFKNISNVTQVTVTFTDTNWSSKLLDVCMCPGGMVVPSSSCEGIVVTNGMSEFARDQKNANSALVVGVGPEDFGSSPLDGIKFQQRLEQQAFQLGGKDYRAPAATVGEFLNHRVGLQEKRVHPSYALGVNPVDFDQLFPNIVTQMMREGLERFGRKIPGFDASDAVLTGPETRTSSPVRITRGEDFCAVGKSGLYPCGEGAGYAGGIMSAAVDGIRIASAIIQKYQPYGG